MRDSRDFTETVVLPESELTKDSQMPSPELVDDGADLPFDQTLVLDDEVAKFRRRRSLQSFVR